MALRNIVTEGDPILRKRSREIEEISPRIVKLIDDMAGKSGEVMRPEKIHVKALDINGNPFEMDAEGLLADCICHEYDHLDGILFIDKAIPGSIEEVHAEK